MVSVVYKETAKLRGPSSQAGVRNVLPPMTFLALSDPDRREVGGREGRAQLQYPFMDLCDTE